ncbi:MAG: PH domain-containing protein [Gordonia sp. (in: high G+C Gram-positive bacteria)]|uniref:PH domain-containing protein n=1 Tax=Gordonia sp. (in: high G+C Gram-positive bacteria) TaxID=84139 RepID=UPI0039E3A33C
MTRPSSAPHTDGPDDWHHQSAPMMAIRPIQQLPSLIPVLLAVVFAGSAAPLFALGVSIIAVGAVSVIPWLTTEYQITDEHVRLRTGVLNRKVATARRDRIRSVDLTAGALHRMLGLKKVVIGTGSDGGSVELDCIAAPYAQAVHDYLMPTGAAALPADVADPTATAVDAPPQVLARFRTDWLRFSPFSIGGFISVAAVLGFLSQFLFQGDVLDALRSTGTTVLHRIADAPVGLLVAIGALIVIGGGALASVGGYVLNYWNFLLARHSDGTLRTSRGLITTNSTSLDEKRVRGVHLHEPVLMRALGGARLFALATGASKHPLLLPPAPRDEAVAVAGAVASSAEELSVPLVPHGPAARRRRWTRAGLSTIPFAAIPVVAGGLGWLHGPTAIVLAALVVVAGIAVAPVRYRHLGSRVTDRLVIIARPSIARHRFLVNRDGIVGWQVRSSPFQRRQGVATLVLATAAGAEAYGLVDLTDDAVESVMVGATPELVRPFLVSTT